MKEIDAIITPSAWESHVDICIDSMLAGKYVATEVGGAYSIEQCWELVRTYERTKVPCMMLENCCYGKEEMTILNMIKKGVFGELVHCEGGYRHDLRDEVSSETKTVTTACATTRTAAESSTRHTSSVRSRNTSTSTAATAWSCSPQWHRSRSV